MSEILGFPQNKSTSGGRLIQGECKIVTGSMMNLKSGQGKNGHILPHTPVLEQFQRYMGVGG
jgi:hypothetical protein